MAGRTVEVARAPDALTAELWIGILADAGIEANSYPTGISAALGGADTLWGTVHPVVVAEEDADEALAVLNEMEGESLREPFQVREDREALQRMVIGLVGLGLVTAIGLALAFALFG